MKMLDQFIAIIFVVMIIVTKHLISIHCLIYYFYTFISYVRTSARFLIASSFFTFS